MSETVGIGEAAKMLGVSTDTLRRWDRAGKVRTTRDARNRRR
ncbi:MAG: MerR family DNA-binding transcriptional regulator, partial [Actinobacteria bacterium]|nr:MerR family DNA-binding transcriptional regulator [Actinomycetota bacterium]